MALPTKKHTRSQRDKRRAHLALTAKQIQSCSKCKSPILAHHACEVCGTYRGRQVLKVA